MMLPLLKQFLVIAGLDPAIHSNDLTHAGS
jgi:hypothetical protein